MSAIAYSQDEWLNWPIFTEANYTVFSQATPADGNCLIHAIGQAIYLPYQEGHYKGVKINPYEETRKLRDQMALALLRKDRRGLTLYQTFSNGIFPELAIHDPKTYSLPAMLDLFYSSRDLGGEMISLLSYLLNKSIYVLEYHKQDIDLMWYREHASAIILLWRGNHYETVNLYDPKLDRLISHFKPERSLIRLLRDRYTSRIV